MTQSPLNPDALAQLIMWKKLPFGGRPDSFIQLDANAAYAVIKLLQPHLAAALPEVTSVEELHQLPSGSIVRASGGSAWKKFGSGWGAWFKAGDSLDYEASIVALPARVLHRPEVNDA